MTGLPKQILNRLHNPIQTDPGFVINDPVPVPQGAILSEIASAKYGNSGSSHCNRQVHGTSIAGDENGAALQQGCETKRIMRCINRHPLG